MEKSVNKTIEELKLQEANTEIKLKENRSLESTIASLNRNIRETVIHIEKSEKEQRELTKRIKKLRSQLELDKIRRDALLAQIDANRKKLAEIRQKSEEGITEVWNLRSSLCNAVHTASNNYDIMALLMKLKSVVTFPKAKILPVKQDSEFERKLKEVTERKENAIKERDRLLNEPETGHEFVRIKNALEFSLEKIASLRSN
ncbi:girdin-like [Papilio machaon]|uniref:girdin-like n=1 Tax=Papilio machaon TaxID=76193 RepID=UPI001E665379|nr:girdin-like [Papilio machaon]